MSKDIKRRLAERMAKTEGNFENQILKQMLRKFGISPNSIDGIEELNLDYISEIHYHGVVVRSKKTLTDSVHLSQIPTKAFKKTVIYETFQEIVEETSGERDHALVFNAPGKGKWVVHDMIGNVSDYLKHGAIYHPIIVFAQGIEDPILFVESLESFCQRLKPEIKYQGE
jgi:hypothetical protein